MNYVVLIGRLKEIQEKHLILNVIEKDKNWDVKCYVGIGSMMQNVSQYCKKNDLVGIKGKIIENNEILIEKITFLSSKTEENE